mmetsp:Transcript_34435/g.40270  ORF Transcript_34435/g.40270 Transcript_34435/m.40270 type:complete len:367 (-) Transcript_34435:459-1559(-)
MLPPRAIGACVAYCVTSTLCVLHNKYILSKVLPSGSALLLVQNVLTIAFLCVASSSFVGKNPVNFIRSCHLKLTLYHSPGDWIIGVCYSMCVVTGVWSLNYLSVPMFTSIKMCTIVVVWLIEFVSSRTETTMQCLLPTLLFIFGTMLMSYYDLQFSALGYLFGAISCVLQAASFELGKRLVNHGKDLWSVLLINALVSAGIQIVLMLGTGEAQSLLLYGQFQLPASATQAQVHAAALASTTPTHILVLNLLLNGVMVIALNYSVFLNCSVNSPLAHVVTGNTKSILTVVSGTILFAVPMRAMAILGICMGLVSSGWFSWVKFRHQSAKLAEQNNVTQSESSSATDSVFVETTASLPADRAAEKSSC